MISLIVATKDRVAELGRLLGSLENQVYREFEVIIVDQNPDDRLEAVLREVEEAEDDVGRVLDRVDRCHIN